ncbi:MAG: phospholipase C, phosphocholine-specific, partial [Pseudopedobacter saltans]
RVRESAIGLGYRVPFIVASPWSRGGYVNSQVFDHTSVVQFIEGFASRKAKKQVVCENVTDWRRAVCGNLDSVFRPYNGEEIKEPTYLKRNEYVQRIDKAQYKPLPIVADALSEENIKQIRENPLVVKTYLQQENGGRKSNSLPYELGVDLQKVGNTLKINFEAATKLFGKKSAGSPFVVYALKDYKKKSDFEKGANWNFTVGAGDKISYDWKIDNFSDKKYQLAVHGPNGFYRLFEGDGGCPTIDIIATNIKNKKRTYGSLELRFLNKENRALDISIIDNAYGKSILKKNISANSSSAIDISLESSFGWYDFIVLVDGYSSYKSIYAGHVENGHEAMSDPQIG